MTILHNVGKGMIKRITLVSTGEVFENVSTVTVDFESNLWSTVAHSLNLEVKGNHELTNEDVKVEIGFWEDASQPATNIQWHNFGTFKVLRDGFHYDDASDTTKITNAFDKMVLTHKEWNDDDINITYPITIKGLVTAICSLVGIELGTQSWLRDNILIDGSYWNVNGIVYRNVLDEVCEVCNVNMLIVNDKLVLKPINKTIVDTIGRGKLSLKVDSAWGGANILNLAREPVHDNYVYPLDYNSIPLEERNEVVFENNQIVDKRREIMAPLLFEQIEGLTYSPFDYSGFGYLTMGFGDYVGIVDKDNNTVFSYITKGSWAASTGFKETLGSTLSAKIKKDYALPTDQRKEFSKVYAVVDALNSKITLEVSKIETKIENIELTPGPSAYEIALENGFTGTEQEWLDSLQGADGENGIPGKDGADGKPTYTWVKYADTPTSGMSNSATDKKYIGLAFNKPTSTMSSNYNDYQWSLMPQNISVGGRNLAYGFDNGTFNYNTGVEGPSQFNKRTPLIKVLPNEKYVVSLSGYEVGEVVEIRYIFRNSITGVYTPGNAFNVYERQITIPSGCDEIKIAYGRAYGHANTVDFEKVKLKLEKGDIATDWSPAPEDVDAEINRVERETVARFIINEDAISTEKSTRETEISDLGESITAVGTKVTQLDDLINTEFSSIKEKVDGTKEEILRNVDDTLTGFNDKYIERFTDVEGNITEFRSNFSYDHPTSTLQIGRSNHDIELNLRNHEAEFRSKSSGMRSSFGFNGMYNKEWSNDSHVIKSYKQGNIEGTIFLDKGSGD